MTIVVSTHRDARVARARREVTREMDEFVKRSVGRSVGRPAGDAAFGTRDDDGARAGERRGAESSV